MAYHGFHRIQTCLSCNDSYLQRAWTVDRVPISKIGNVSWKVPCGKGEDYVKALLIGWVAVAVVIIALTGEVITEFAGELIKEPTGEVTIELTGEDIVADVGFEGEAFAFVTLVKACELALIEFVGETFVAPAVDMAPIAIEPVDWTEGETALDDALIDDDIRSAALVAAVTGIVFDCVPEADDAEFVLVDLIEVSIEPLVYVVIAVVGSLIKEVRTDGESEVAEELTIVDTDGEEELCPTEVELSADGLFDDILVKSMDVAASLLNTVESCVVHGKACIKQINKMSAFRKGVLFMMSDQLELVPLVCMCVWMKKRSCFEKESSGVHLPSFILPLFPCLMNQHRM